MFSDWAFTALLNALLLCSSIARVIAAPIIPINDTFSIPISPLDFGVDYTNDPFPPYPPFTNPDGSNISIANLRGTRLYGWKGCASSEMNIITQAYNDFHTLAKQPAIYKNIDFSSLAARQFWGPVTGRNRINNDRMKEIQRKFYRTRPTRKLTPLKRYLRLPNRYMVSAGGCGRLQILSRAENSG
jgi:hypothetical protein